MHEHKVRMLHGAAGSFIFERLFLRNFTMILMQRLHSLTLDVELCDENLFVLANLSITRVQLDLPLLVRFPKLA